MIPVQIQLTDEQARALEKLAADRQMSVSDLISQSVARLIHTSAIVRSEVQKQRAMAAAGRFHSGQSDISSKHDDYLAKAYIA